MGTEPDANECATVAEGSDTAATTEENYPFLNQGSSLRSCVTDGNNRCRSTQSPSSGTLSPLSPPVKKDNCPECFSDTSLEAGHMVKEKEDLNISRVKEERQRKTFEQEMSSNLTSAEMPSKLSHLASGDDDSSEDGDRSCPSISCMPDYLKDFCESSSRSTMPRVMDVHAPAFSPVFLSENQPNSSRQSSVKQLESFVASVECHSPSKPKASEKKGPSIVQMTVAALSRKCKSSRLKTQSLNHPKMLKQPFESVCQYAVPPLASDPNQPLDLSVKTRQKDVQPSETKYLSCSSDSTISAVGTTGSCLADLEKKFGNTSAIFDRIGTKTWASPFCGALVSRLGMNMYNSKLHGAFSDSVSAFGIGMIPVPVQRFNTSLSSAQAVPAAKPDGSLSTKPEQTEPAAINSETVCHTVEPSFQWHQKQTADASSDQRKHTNFQCSCGAELETLYHLTMHLQQTGHAPNKLKNVGRQEYSKLVRGQDMWLNHGCEQTRQILRCMECDESFKSLPELTVHMIQTKHYANIVGADTLQRKVPLKNSESRSEPSSESSDVNRVHCLVCLEAFDDPESLGNHVLEAGHYKSTPERGEDDMISKKDFHLHSSRPKSGPDSVVDPGSPQSGIEDSSSLDTLSIKTERDRKRDHSSEACTLDSCRKSETAKRCRTMRSSSTSDDNISKGLQEKELREREYESPGRFAEPAFEAARHSSSAGFKETLELVPGFPRETDSLPESCDDASYKPNCPQRSVRSDSEKSCRAKEEAVEKSNSSAFHMENFFRPPSNSSLDGSAIRAMETFIKNSFGTADTKHRSKVLHQMSHVDSTSLVSSIISQFGTYVDNPKPSHNMAGRQESRSSETPENSSLYRNKYLPPIYIAPLSDSQSENNRVLVDGQSWPASQRVKSESTEVIPQMELERQSVDSEGPSREPESGVRELERPASIERQKKTNWSQQRPDKNTHPDPFRKSEADSVIQDKFRCSINASNSSTDLKAAERAKGGIDVGDTETDERPTSTSNSLSRSSALESLQGLVYGKALNSEHPLDSLQKLIYGRAGAGGAVVNSSGSGSGVGHHVLQGPNGSSAAVIMKGADALHHPLPHGTLILVNPIVTVVPGTSGSNPSLNITLPDFEPSPGSLTAGADDGAKRSEMAGRRLQSPLDDRENSLRIYRCRGCRRKFSSKGSYRYHLSRCHVLTSSSSTSSEKCSSVKEPLKKCPYICLPLDATAKFNKYYKLASELGTEAK